MLKLSEFLKGKIFRRYGQKRSTLNVEELRTAFKSRYHHFKLLLNANNRALEIMAEIEQILRANQPFGMSFIKARCTAVSVNVFQIIRNLDQIAPEKYKELYSRFRHIQEHINQALAVKRIPQGAQLVVPLKAVDKNMADEVGSKMANLGEIANNLHLPVPSGFVISAAAYQRLMEHKELQAEIDSRVQSTEVERIDNLYELSANIQQLIIRSEMPEDLERAILEAYKELEKEAGAGIKVSMRSSALGEDRTGASFAGQYRSELNISAAHLIQAYKQIIAGKYSMPAMTYRLNKGIRDEDISMCVGCLVMINAVAGGVMYSRNPLHIRDDSIVINAVWGLPKSIVDGTVAFDHFVISRNAPITFLEKAIKIKDRKFECYPEEGIRRVDLTADESSSQSITDAQALELASVAVKVEQYYGSPQDIEWAIDSSGTVYVLQCRPLQQADISEREGRGFSLNGKEPVILQGGITASPGTAYGPVFLVQRNADILQFQEGAVVVTSQPLPGWAALMNRAVAVVAEQGGVTGHLANVAREFGVPALFSVPGATEKLKNGDLITVDADAHRIYQGRIESLLARSERKKNLMEGTPVYDVLQEVTKHIVPLTLIDPDATSFTPKRCKTFHDITRFAHEKSVHEMFNFGKDYHFPERSSKQLVCDVPMQWWIINLDDGFKEEVKGKFIPLGTIASIPMKALWEGITAVPWLGPPPVDTKGFMSVMFQATTNPALDPSMKSHYTDRNYFMISKNFCSLQSRFGFHFSTVETLVSERPIENYISFQFKGGAADFQRRLKRVIFVGNILSEFGFRVEIKEDALFARIEGYEEEYMKERLKILGYLIIHTRQLDMIMANDASLRHHKAKIIKDLNSIIAQPKALPVQDEILND